MNKPPNPRWMMFLFVALGLVWVAGCDLKGSDLSPDNGATASDPALPPPAVPPIIGSSVPVGNIIYGSAMVSTFAGVPGISGNVDGIGSAARFVGPAGLGTDGLSLHVTESLCHVVRRVDLATAMVTTVAGIPCSSGNSNGKLWDPIDIEPVSGTWYFTELRNRRFNFLSGFGSTVVGGGPSFTQIYMDGVADPFVSPPVNQARFYSPRGLASVLTMLYIADINNRVIRSYDTVTRLVGTVAGMYSQGGYRDGPAHLALFDMPTSLATDGSNLYIGEIGGLIRRLDLTTMEVTTLAGNGELGFVDGPGFSAQFTSIVDMAYESGFLYVCDWLSRAIRKIDVTTGAVTTVAGGPTKNGHLDGDGDQARFESVGGIAIFGGNMYVSDTNNRVIRLITGY